MDCPLGWDFTELMMTSIHNLPSVDGRQIGKVKTFLSRLMKYYPKTLENHSFPSRNWGICLYATNGVLCISV